MGSTLCMSSLVRFPTKSIFTMSLQESQYRVDRALLDFLSLLLSLLLLLLLLLELEEPELLLPDIQALPLLSDLLPLSDLSGLLLDFMPLHDFLCCCSQCRASIVCARVFISLRVEGLLCWPMISLIRVCFQRHQPD